MANENQNVRLIELGVQYGNVNYRDMLLALAALAQESARTRVAAASVPDITDSSGGTADPSGALNSVTVPASVVQDGVELLAPKAEFDTQMGLVEDAHRELLTTANLFIAAVSGGVAATVADLTSGAAADATIAAITTTLTGSAAADQGVEAASGKAQLVVARNNQASICAAINWVRTAQGLAPVADSSGGIFERTQTEYETYDAAATGTAAAAGEASLGEVETETALTRLRINISTMAAALAECDDPQIGPFVVATNNPRFRFVNADVTA